MQAVILAAGKGTRLHPLTSDRSKAMLPVLGKPIVERVIESLLIKEVEEVILVVNPRDVEITRHFSKRPNLPIPIRIVHQPQPLGMAQALACAVPILTGRFVVAACDNLVTMETVKKMLAAWEAKPHPHAILALITVEPDRIRSVGIVAVEGQRVTRIVEKPAPEEAPSNIACLPLYCFSPRILDLLDKVTLSPRDEYELPSAIQMLIESHGLVRGVMVDNRLTLTEPKDLLDINRYFLQHAKGQVKVAPREVENNSQLIPPLYIEEDASVGSGCVIGPNVFIESGSRIGGGVKISDTVVLRGARVPDGAAVSETVIY